MTIIEINQVSKRYAMEPVLEQISCKLEKGEKIGLIGANGCGKSTLLKLIAGVEAPSSGTITRPTGATVGYLAQEMARDEQRTVRQEVMQVFAGLQELGGRLEALEPAMANSGDEARQRRALAQYSRLAGEFERRGGYTVDHRVDAVLEGLRLSGRQRQPIASLSGGEKNLVALARVLLAEPDILLLDEPANHLDFAGLEWLENFLQDCRQTVVLVSHNRYLLDRVVGAVLEIEQGRLTRYAGNYSWYRAEKAKNLLARQAAYRDQQQEIRRLEEMIARYERWASQTNDPRQARRARNKQRALDRMDKIERPELDPRRIAPSFVAADKGGRIALEVKGYSRAFTGRVLFDQVDLHLSYGDRVGLLGANGTGKSTLFRDLVTRAAWDDPVLRIGPQVRLGYYAQEHETLHPQRTILRELLELPGLTRERAFAALSRFLFRWEDMDRTVETLSGGEKSRVQLAKLMVSQVNFLLLDEPTNHLDIFSRERVEEALEEFAGTLLVISHDRYFLDRIVDRIVELEPPHLKEYAGNFSYFWKKKNQPAISPIGERPPKSPRREKPPSLPVPVDGQIVDQLAVWIEQREADKLRLEEELAATYRKDDRQTGARLAGDLRRLNGEIERLYAKWGEMAL